MENSYVCDCIDYGLVLWAVVPLLNFDALFCQTTQKNHLRKLTAISLIIHNDSRVHTAACVSTQGILQ
jgi:hypothetical protein